MSHTEEKLFYACTNFCEAFFRLLCEKNKVQSRWCPDDEYCYTLDTQGENYKTLEDFEKEEFENAKKEGIDINEYEDVIMEK